ncbi:hypothetical protein WH8501_29820 [Crocosphaera watsonii WH 8501]
MASHESFCKNLVDYFRQAALVLTSFLIGFFLFLEVIAHRNKESVLTT